MTATATTKKTPKSGSAQPAPPVVIHEVSCSFGKKRVLKKIDFSLNTGELTCLLGLNGAGKTTTMRVMSGLLVPGEGEVRIGGFDPSVEPAKVRQVMGILPEENILDSELTVREHFYFVGRVAGYRGNLKARIKELVALFSLGDVYHTLAGVLSKGYRQRVGLALALLTDPPIIMLDEPSSGLDPEQRHAFHDLLKKIAKDKTVLLSTHLLPDVKALADRVLVITRGTLVYDGVHPGDDALRKALLGEALPSEEREGGHNA